MNIEKKILIAIFRLISGCVGGDYKIIAIQPELAYLYIENPMQLQDGTVSVDLRVVNNTKYDLIASYERFCGSIGQSMQTAINIEVLVDGTYIRVRDYGAILEGSLNDWVVESGENKTCTLTLDDKFAITGHRNLKVSFPKDGNRGFAIKGRSRVLAHVESNELYFEVLRPTKYNKNIFNTDHLKPVPTTPLPLEDSN